MNQYWPPQDIPQWFQKFRFKTPIQVRFSDTDMLGHINNVSYFSYFETGRLAYFEELQLSPYLFNLKEKQSIVTANLECQYLREVRLGQSVELGVKCERIGKSSLDLIYALYLPEGNTIAAIGRGTIVLISMDTGKSTPLPPEVKQIITAYEELE